MAPVSWSKTSQNFGTISSPIKKLSRIPLKPMQQIGTRARQPILAEHTWEHCWHTVLSDGFAHSDKGTLHQDSEA